MTVDQNEFYLPRVLDPIVDLHLQAFGAIEIAGTMWSGKTWTAKHHGSSYITFENKQTRELAQLDPSAILKGVEPRIIDEWQEVPQIFDTVRNSVDDAAGKKGMYILTGSSRPEKERVRHTGSGRISRLKMWPMSLYELGKSDGSVSLTALFEGSFESGPTETNLGDLASYVCRGGWPAIIDLPNNAAELVAGQYLDALFAKKDAKAPGTERELRMFMRSLARNIGSAVTYATLAKDMGLVDEKGKVTEAAEKRIREFLDYFDTRYVTCDLSGWDAPIKSPSRLRTKPKHCFADPSLPAALLGAGEETLLANLQLFGQLFEELCLRDLRVYTSALPGAHADSLRYYRDADGLEVDAIIELRDGRWGAIEIKLGANKADEAVQTLVRLKKKIAANPAAQNPEPSFMLVLVGKTDFKYRTPEGVVVAPITSLTV